MLPWCGWYVTWHLYTRNVVVPLSLYQYQNDLIGANFVEKHYQTWFSGVNQSAKCRVGLTLHYLLDDLVVKLLGAAPLADAAEAVGVAAARQDAEAPLGWRRLLIHHLHADTAHFLLALLHCKRLLHVLLKRTHTHL